MDSQGWCRLHGRVIKAANSRALAPFVAEMAEAFNDGDTAYDRLVLRATKSMARFYEIIYRAGVVLSASELGELRRVTARLGAALQELRDLARVRELFAWNIVPKTHACMHFPELAEFVNPRYVQCYQAESQVGTMTTIWNKGAHGRYRHTAQRMVLVKRLVALHCRLEDVL